MEANITRNNNSNDNRHKKTVDRPRFLRFRNRSSTGDRGRAWDEVNKKPVVEDSGEDEVAGGVCG